MARRRSRRSSGRRGRTLKNLGAAVALGEAVATYGPSIARGATTLARAGGRALSTGYRRFRSWASRNPRKYAGGAAATGGTAGYVAGSRNRRAAAVSNARSRRGGIRSGRARGNREVGRFRSRFGKARRVTTSKLARLNLPCRILSFGGCRAIDDSGISIDSRWGPYVAQAGAAPTGRKKNATGDAPNGIAGLPGFYMMSLDVSTSTQAGSFDSYPLYVCDLNVTPNNSAYPSALYQMGTDVNTGNVIFNWVAKTDLNGDYYPGVGQTGNGNFNWEYTSGPNAGNSTTCPAVRYVMPSWYDIRLVLYSCLTQQTTYIIEYVQFMVDHFSPTYAVSDMTTLELQERNSYYRDKVRNLITNPIARRVTPVRKGGYKVLKKWTVSFPPNLTTEQDSSPNSKVVRLFIRDGRTLKYFDNQTATLPTDADMIDPNYQQADDTSLTYLSRPRWIRHRRALIIRAVNTVNTSGAAVPTTSNTPSFDFILRKKEYLSDL